MHTVLDHGEVELIAHAGGDESVLRSMLVSTGKDDENLNLQTWHIGDSDPDEREVLNEVAARNAGRINYLMKNKHGTPFEHNMFTFRVKAPIFVLREWHRHRIGWSYNEQSGRYMELGNHWYEPKPEHVRKRVGKPGHYTYEPFNPDGAEMFIQDLSDACNRSYGWYLTALDSGIAPEQARLFLHVNHYSSMYATCNARSLMHFLALRNEETAQWEIQQYAAVLEHIFAEEMPVTYARFVANGRVAP